ncbi:hypothetical protein BT67DRAFT_14432 [Trichocladium antarcticum]|uniref:DUF6590 domain-containing protein n=1 Tax=Trichocladium antarcticum TaxID=1450529 RepID=A0AAN6USU5_9PEZI|nr:hypothetical protein BT67DRAFT_14432 [Trichocladium antarcticum]
MAPGRRNIWGEWSEWTWDEDQVRYWRARQDIQGSTVAYSTSPVQGHAAFSETGRGKRAEPPAKSKSRGYKDASRDKTASSKKYRSKPARGYVEGYPGDPSDPPHDHEPFSEKTTPPTNTRDHAFPSPSNAASIDPLAPHETGFGVPSHAASIDPQVSPHEPGFETSSHASAFTSGFPRSSNQDYMHDQTRSPAHHRAGTRYPDQGQYGRRDHTSNRETRRQTSRREDSPPQQPTAGYYTTDPDILVQDEPSELQAAISQADAYHTGAPSATYPVGRAASMATAHSHAYEFDSGQRTPRQSPQQGAEVVQDYPYLDNTTSRVGIGRGPDTRNEYVVEHSSRFKPGEVFKILWCEPLGAGAPRSEVITNFVGMQERDGQRFYQGFRRFIVVANDEGHCTCVPILTYEHKACTKKGVKPLKHGIVFQLGKKARMVDGEPDLGFRPVRVDLYEKSEKLDKESRVNYAKLTTVEHNFPVFFIGRVVPDDFGNIVGPAVDLCWTRKRRYNQ